MSDPGLFCGRWIFSCAFGASLLAAGGAVAAQHDDSARQSQPPGTTQPAPPQPSRGQAVEGAPPASTQAAPTFEMLDTNGNGTIDEQEAQAHRRLHGDFETVDSNRDGQISESEFAAFGEVDRRDDVSSRDVEEIREEAAAQPAEGASPGESWFTAPEDKPESAIEGMPRRR